MIQASIADAPTLSTDDKLWSLIHLFILSECHLNEYFGDDDSDGRSQNSGRTHLVWEGYLTSHTTCAVRSRHMAEEAESFWTSRVHTYGSVNIEQYFKINLFSLVYKTVTT